MATKDFNLSSYDKAILASAAPFRFGIVASEWNDEITGRLLRGCTDTLKELGALPENITTWRVPGSFELAYGAKKMIEKERPDAVIAIGCVIRGETSHFDYVCQGVTQGIMNLNITLSTPVIFCVLTDDTKQQSLDRSGGIYGNKGSEAAISALKMITLGL